MKLTIVYLLFRLTDICNATGVSDRGVHKGCECIDSPDHLHLNELLSILKVFCKWKSDTGTNTEKYLPWQSHKYLCWLVFSLVGISKLYLKKDLSRVMVQRRAGTDDCEHEFAGSRLRNPKPTQGDMRKVTARRAGTRCSSVFTNLNKSNTSGDKSIYVDELIKPIRKKRKFK